VDLNQNTRFSCCLLLALSTAYCAYEFQQYCPSPLIYDVINIPSVGSRLKITLCIRTRFSKLKLALKGEKITYILDKTEGLLEPELYPRIITDTVTKVSD
jgi:hypothetical protein